MLSILNGLRDMTCGAVIFRMLFACVCGGLIGLERSSKNRTAGFRTHMLVCVAGSIAAMTGLYLYLVLRMPTDISRISGQIITGLGFIGAGTIVITKRLTIKGLTTAAGLWATGIIGLAIGSGYYELGIVSTALILLIETWFGKISAAIQGHPEYSVELLYNEKTSLDQVLRFCKDNRMAIVNLKIHSLDVDAEARYAAEINLRGNMKRTDLLMKVQQMPGIVSIIGY